MARKAGEKRACVPQWAVIGQRESKALKTLDIRNRRMNNALSIKRFIYRWIYLNFWFVGFNVLNTLIEHVIKHVIKEQGGASGYRRIYSI